MKDARKMFYKHHDLLVTFVNTNPPTGGDLLSGLSPTQLGQIVNWSFSPYYSSHENGTRLGVISTSTGTART